MKFINFERLLGFSSLFIASCAAFFSIVGIGMLFSGSAIAAMIMASSLELGKLVATSFLYRYWNKTKTFLKLYLTTSVVVLMIITSLGIFGYLSSAYQQSSIENQLIEQKIQLIEEQKISVKDKISTSKGRIANVTQLRNSQESRLSQSMTNTLIARNPIQLRQIQQQTQELIEQSEKDLESEAVKIQKATDELQNLDKQITTLKLESGSKKDVQTFKFVADEFGVNVNKVVKWFIIALISVFDPLAVCLLLAYNTSLSTNSISKSEETIFTPPSTTIKPINEVIENTNVSSVDTNSKSDITNSTVEVEPSLPVESIAAPATKTRPYPFSF
jgi:hypothetical protein